MTTSLITSKSRVNPVKQHSIPRLELMGTNLLFETLHCVYNELCEFIEISDIIAWIDSTGVYSWIRNECAK